jgi:hypothetical protein
LTTGKRQNKYLPSLTWSSAHFEESSTGELDGSTRHSDLPFFDLSIIIAVPKKKNNVTSLGKVVLALFIRYILLSLKEF